MAKKKTTKKTAGKGKPVAARSRVDRSTGKLKLGTGRRDDTPELKAECKAKFLEGLADNYGCITDGCKRAGISRGKCRTLRKEDPEFNEAVEEIIEEFTDALEKSAMKRAIEGSARAVTSMGEVVGEDMIPETSLTIFMLKAKRRTTYGDQVKISITADEFAREVQALIGDEDDSAIEGLSRKNPVIQEENQ